MKRKDTAQDYLNPVSELKAIGQTIRKTWWLPIFYFFLFGLWLGAMYRIIFLGR